METADRIVGPRSRRGPGAALLIAIVILGLVARLPGVTWGSNFPGKWQSHHPDEFTHYANTRLLLDPTFFGTWQPHPYPKGLAASVAVPAIAVRKMGLRDADWPDRRIITLAGRVVSVLYGAATIVVLVLLGNRLFADRRIGITAGLILALGGLHVTQSHFFVSDVAGLFWLLVGLYLLLRELERPLDEPGEFLAGAAFAMGAAFGMKLVVAGLPSLALVVLMRGPRGKRVIQATVYGLVGFVVINAASYTPHELYDTLQRGVGDPYVYSRLRGVLLYLIETPSIASLPLTLFGLAGAAVLAARLARPTHRHRLMVVALVVILPVLVHGYFVVMRLDHFPRHLVPFLPWLALTGAWSLIALSDRLRIHPAVVTVPFFLYLGAFVIDGERVFIDDPRNEAARWILANVPSGSTIWWRGAALPGYEYLRYPMAGEPAILVMDMKDANHYLSGMGWRDSYPRDSENIFDSYGQEWVDAMQAVFRGTTAYREVARFGEGYVMPEYTITDRLIGNRSRNYVAEIVIFERNPARLPSEPRDPQ